MSDSGVDSIESPLPPVENIPTPPSVADSLSSGTSELINEVLNISSTVESSPRETRSNPNQGYKREVINEIN